MKLSTACDGFLLAKRVAGCSSNTIRNYTLNLRRLRHQLGDDSHLSNITADQIRAALNQLMTARITPRGVAKRPSRTLSAKTIKNIHTCWMSLWTWANKEGHATHHPVKHVDVPKPEPPAIDPLTRDQVRALLKATARSVPWERSPGTTNEIPKRRRLRDRAILLFLLDTGVRVGELCTLTIDQVDLQYGTAKVRSKGRMDRGEGKERVIRFAPATSKAIWNYLAERDALKRKNKHEPLFTTRENRPLERRALGKHLARLGRRADINNVHAHRFRHTFAINYLRNGGDIYTLQMLLGHTSLEMVKRYLALAQADTENAHRRASPVDNWNL